LYTYQYPRPAVTVDIAIFMPKNGEFYLLLIQRAQEPYKRLYALPGGFMEINETLAEAATRELEEETGLKMPSLTQVHTFSAVDRDPRGRVVSTCFAGMLTTSSQTQIQARDDAAHLDWFNLNNLPPLAFDHAQVIKTVVQKFLSPS
jgi:8-oxo-dGTP diphosphatase